MLDFLMGLVARMLIFGWLVWVAVKAARPSGFRTWGRTHIQHSCPLPQTWYKQWKVRSGCLEKFALGNSRGSSDFPEGRSPKGKSDDLREFPWANFSDNP